MFATFKVSGTPHNVVVPFGTQAPPIAGDPMFAWYLNQTNYSVTGGDGFVTVNLAMDQAGTMVGYVKPFGYLNHAYGAETGANGANNTLFMDAVGQTAKGGYFVYQLITASGGAGAGTVTLSLDDSANSTAWTALSGATSGALVTANTSAATIPQSGMIKLSSTAVVRQYLRWQLALSVQTTATFVCGFIRNT
jgi:hypothetical protein